MNDALETFVGICSNRLSRNWLVFCTTWPVFESSMKTSLSSAAWIVYLLSLILNVFNALITPEYCPSAITLKFWLYLRVLVFLSMSVFHLFGLIWSSVAFFGYPCCWCWHVTEIYCWVTNSGHLWYGIFPPPRILSSWQFIFPWMQVWCGLLSMPGFTYESWWVWFYRSTATHLSNSYLQIQTPKFWLVRPVSCLHF